MGSKAITISFLASSGVHLALFGGLMVTGYQFPNSEAHSHANAQTTIDFAAMPWARPDGEIAGLPPREVTPPEKSVFAQEEQPRPVVVEPLVKDVVEPLEVKLGIDDGNKESRNWIGFKDPTEFRAPKSTVDQAEVAINPGDASLSSGAPGKPGPAGAVGEPGQASPATASGARVPLSTHTAPAPLTAAGAATGTAIGADQQSPDGKPTSPAEHAAAVKGEGPETTEAKEKIEAAHATLGKPEIVPAATSVFDQPLPPQAKGVANAVATDSGEETTSREAVDKRDAKVRGTPSGDERGAADSAAKAAVGAAPAGASAPAAIPAATGPSEQGNQGQRGSEGNNASGATVTGDKPGQKDDREADASAVIDSIEVVPGKPAAAKGLRIQTSRPQWSMATKLTARPRNPTVRITFGPTGRVSKAEFVAGKNSGYVDVDQPLLNAVYRWTARGEAIDKLHAGNPKAGVTITVNILLN
jgi:hypothetical protein